MLVTPLSSDHLPAVRELARAAGAPLDLPAEALTPSSLVWVARPSPGEPPVAFLHARHVADELHLMQLATHPAARRRGAARALMRRLLAEAVHRRARLVLLEVRRSNRPAIRLYRSHGFSAIGVRRDYYADGPEDAVEMWAELDPTTGVVRPGRDEVALAGP